MSKRRASVPGFVLAADIGGTKIAAARVSPSGAITHSLQSRTPVAGGRAAAHGVIELLRRLPQSAVCAIAVGVPGLAYADGRVWAPNIRGWTNLPLRAILRKEFRLPVVVESDRNAFVVGEAWCGAARNCKDAVFLIVGTGIGAGIVAGERLVGGHAGLAGALGWMAVRDELRPEYRAVGCLESHLAGPGISRRARALLGREVTTREIARLARRGDPRAKQVIREAAHDLGLALANLVSTLNPEVIVVGGGIGQLGELLLAPARRTMRLWAQPLASRQVRVVRSRLGTRAGLLGVAKLAFDRHRQGTK